MPIVGKTGSLVGETEASGGGSSAWGSITGTLSAQEDLQAALDSKAPASQFAGFNKITASTTAPSAPATGDIWIDTN